MEKYFYSAPKDFTTFEPRLGDIQLKLYEYMYQIFISIHLVAAGLPKLKKNSNHNGDDVGLNIYMTKKN